MELPEAESGQYGPKYEKHHDDNVYNPSGYDDYGDGRQSTHGASNSRYHTKKLLVYTPGYRNLYAIPRCELHTMALVGQHIFHKTEKQLRGIWSTIEHKDNAPDCTDLPPAGDIGGRRPEQGLSGIGQQEL